VECLTDDVDFEDGLRSRSWDIDEFGVAPRAMQRDRVMCCQLPRILDSDQSL
jgi:hypothetical protein